MHQLTGKKVKIITYLILLFILSTTSGKFSSNQNTYSSKIKKINVEGLSNTENLKISNLIKYPRQLQWTGLRNKTVFPKIEYLLESFEHQGPMSELLR